MASYKRAAIDEVTKEKPFTKILLRGLNGERQLQNKGAVKLSRNRQLKADKKQHYNFYQTPNLQRL